MGGPFFSHAATKTSRVTASPTGANPARVGAYSFINGLIATLWLRAFASNNQ
jgi:hypothetical protein